MENFINFISIIAATTAVFIPFDKFADNKTKHSVSWYLFGFHDLNFSDFDSKVITLLLKPFLNDQNKLSAPRIMTFTAICLLLPILLFGFLFGTLSSNPGALLEVFPILVLLLAICTLSSFYADYWSFFVSKKIFIDFKPKFPISIFYIFIDLLLSSALPFLILFILTKLNSYDALPLIGGKVTENTFFAIIFFGSLLGSYSIILVTAMQIIVLVIGTIFRVFSKLTRLNNAVAMNSQAHEYPFTYIGLFLGLLIASTYHLVF